MQFGGAVSIRFSSAVPFAPPVLARLLSKHFGREQDAATNEVIAALPLWWFDCATSLFLERDSIIACLDTSAKMGLP